MAKEKEQQLLKAINNITAVIRLHKGTYDEHVQLQNDLKLIIDQLNNILEEKQKDDETRP